MQKAPDPLIYIPKKHTLGERMEMGLNKKETRKMLGKIRDQISKERRAEAARALLLNLTEVLFPYNFVLSFSSFKNEIDTSLLNRFLAHTGRLLLPKMKPDGSLEIYRVTDVENELESNAFGILEPVENLCKIVSLNEIQVVLVPGLGFDKSKFRIGLGEGFYDRFLPQVSKSLTIGVGFKEQFLDSLPVEKNDYCLSEVSLF